MHARDDYKRMMERGLNEKGIGGGMKASRTFAHRTLAHDWYFIDACNVNRPF